MIEQTVEELTPIVGTRPACRALGVAPATIYRRRRPPAPRPPRPRRLPARALSEQEREAVLAELHSERFVDCSPARVWATLLDEGRYLASERTMYRLLETAQIAKALIAQATEQQQIEPSTLTVHADRGSPMRSKPVAFLLADLRRPEDAQPMPARPRSTGLGPFCAVGCQN